MATDAANIDTAISQITARIAEVTADPNPDYSVGGRSISKGAYLGQLIEALERLRAQRQTMSGPWEIKIRGIV